MRRYRRGSEWAAILEEYKRSGMSVKSFCRERGLCATSIYRRRGKGDVSASYEISVEGVTLKVPSRESAARIAELMRAVRC